MGGQWTKEQPADKVIENRIVQNPWLGSSVTFDAQLIKPEQFAGPVSICNPTRRWCFTPSRNYCFLRIECLPENKKCLQLRLFCNDCYAVVYTGNTAYVQLHPIPWFDNTKSMKTIHVYDENEGEFVVSWYESNMPLK